MKSSMKRNNQIAAGSLEKLSGVIPTSPPTVEKSRLTNSRSAYRQFRDGYLDLSSVQLPETKTLRRLNYSFFDIPKEFCKTPFYCQKKLRLIQKTFKKNVASTLRATGLEVAAQYYLGRVDRRSAASLRKNIADLGMLEKVKEPLDWELEPQCIFCASEAANKELQTTFSPLLGFSATRPDVIPMNGSLPSDSEEPTDLRITKRVNVGKEEQIQKRLLNNRRANFVFDANTLGDKAGAKNGPLDLLSEKVAPQRSSKQSRRTPVREPKSKRGAGVHQPTSFREDADVAQCGNDVSTERMRVKSTKEPVRELKRAASKDLTSALKQIINRHISEKTRAELKNEDQDSNSSNALRNKRGRYRRYDKGDLDEALKAVKNGDMTVHRAGHLFGIPHSTLEYKIKERNILSKRTPDREKRTSVPSEGPTSSSSPTPATDPSTSQPIKSEPSTPSTPLSALSPIFLQLPSLSPFSWSPSMDSIIPNLSFGFNPTFFPNAFCRNIFGTTPFFTPTPSTSLPFRPWICSMATTPLIKSEPTEEITTDVEVVGQVTKDAPLDLMTKRCPNSS